MGGGEKKAQSSVWELELELLQSHMTQKPVLRVEVDSSVWVGLNKTAEDSAVAL